jgi:hypothetical protein
MNLPDKLCPIFKHQKICKDCPQAEQQWFVADLLQKLAEIKGRSLTATEQCWLLLLLQGYSPAEIASRFQYQQKSFSFTDNIFQYVAGLTGERIRNWALVRLFLERQGYRVQVPQSPELIEMQIVIRGNINSVQLLVDLIQQACDSGTLTLKTTHNEQSNE